MRIIINDIIRTVVRSLPQGFTLAVIISVVFEYIRHKTLNGYISSLENKKKQILHISAHILLYGALQNAALSYSYLCSPVKSVAGLGNNKMQSAKN